MPSMHGGPDSGDINGINHSSNNMIGKGNGIGNGSRMLPTADLEHASKYAIRVGKEIASYSKLIVDNRDEIPLLEREEVVLGDLLGSGGFNNVFEVHTIELMDDVMGSASSNPSNSTTNNTTVTVTTTSHTIASSQTINPASTTAGSTTTTASGAPASPHAHLTRTPAQIVARRMLVKRCNNGNSNNQNIGPLAIKFLNENCKSSSEDYANGAADLVLETLYLTALASYPHPNIIRLHGIAAAGPEGFATGAEGAYFLILDRLSDTLDGRMEVWKELERRKRANMAASPEFEQHLKALFVKQLQVGVDLASALSHLHKLKIIFRDLKPDNIGFDSKGVLKLFDFGLAKELDNRQKNTAGLYQMSGGTGSRRYMAPEVSRSEAYYLSADIYSYAIVLWETLSLQKAYWEMTLEDHTAHVVNGENERPKLPIQSVSNYFNKGSSSTSGTSKVIEALLEACWHRDASQRPPSKHIQKVLQQEVDGFCTHHGIRVHRLRRGSLQ